jgi:hypothetical protein
MTLDESAAIPKWVLPLGIAGGAVTILISLCGCEGARKSPKHIDQATCNPALTFYLVCLLIGIAAEVIIAVMLLTLVGTIDSAQEGNFGDEAVQEFDQDFKEWITENPGKWVDTQNYFGCCGYDSNTDTTATGRYCNADSIAIVPTCRARVMEATKEESLLIGILAAVFGFLELIALIAASCLLCCVHRYSRPMYAAAAVPGAGPTVVTRGHHNMAQPVQTGPVVASGPTYHPAPAYTPAYG